MYTMEYYSAIKMNGILQKMDGIDDHYIKENKSGTERQI